MTQLHLDLQAPTSRVDAVWSFGGRAGPAPLLLRKEVRRHLLLCRDELRFRHVRCEGVLGPEMVAERGDGSLDFDKVEAALDWMMENGLVPFFTLQCPGAGVEAAAGRHSWQERVGALAAHVDGRYGCDAREWYFEVCADERGGAGRVGAGPDAFKHYDLAARAIREVHPEYRVGGPAARGTAGLDAFLAHAAKPAEAAEGADRPEGFSPDVLRCDFVTAYADGGGPTPADARRRVTAALGQHVPLIVVGGAAPAVTAAGPPDFERDGCNHAAAVARAAVEGAGECQGFLNANVSDVSLPDVNNERGWRFEPFHGGGGLVTVNDVPQSRLPRAAPAARARRLPLRARAGALGGAGPGAGLPGDAIRAHAAPATLVSPGGGDGRRGRAAAARGCGGDYGGGRAGAVHNRRAAGFGADGRGGGDPPGGGQRVRGVGAGGAPAVREPGGAGHAGVGEPPALAEVDFREYPPRLEPGMVMQLTMQLPFGEGD